MSVANQRTGQRRLLDIIPASSQTSSLVRSLRVVVGLIVLFLAVGRAPADDVRVYFGNLHAHSAASDGNKGITPAEAYRIARDEGKLDFLSLSEHNHIMPDQATYDAVMAAAQAATGSGFVALFGQEYSTINKGFNHTNIQNYPIRIPPALNGKYRQVFGTVIPTFLASHANTIIVGEFNHPGSFDTDYGLDQDYHGDIDAFVQDMDPIVKLIAVASGPADADKKNFVPTGGQRFVHQSIQTERWFKYLSLGMHLAPKIDHDTHSPTYGFRHAGRTAVWVKGGLSADKLLNALAARHCYATEDKNLRIVPDMGPGRLPGDILPITTSGPLTVKLTLSDDDEPNANYLVEVFCGVSGDGQPPKRVDSLTSLRSGNGTVQTSLQLDVGAPTYYVIHVQQTFDDPVNGSKRDDAWLAPIWTGEAGAGGSSDDAMDGGPSDDEVVVEEFFSSRRSDTYHLPGCRVIDQIKPENLVRHTSPPPDKHLHQGCPLH